MGRARAARVGDPASKAALTLLFNEYVVILGTDALIITFYALVVPYYCGYGEVLTSRWRHYDAFFCRSDNARQKRIERLDRTEQSRTTLHSLAQ